MGIPIVRSTLGAKGMLTYTEICTCACTPVVPKTVKENKATNKTVNNLVLMTFIIKLLNKYF
jgi:hypothetical protein